jgi:hypothetical protein
MFLIYSTSIGLYYFQEYKTTGPSEDYNNCGNATTKES